MVEFTDKFIRWVATILAIGIPKDIESFSRITKAINSASEEIFQCRLNILQSKGGHLYVNSQPFRKILKTSNK